MFQKVHKLLLMNYTNFFLSTGSLANVRPFEPVHAVVIQFTVVERYVSRSLFDRVFLHEQPATTVSRFEFLASRL